MFIFDSFYKQNQLKSFVSTIVFHFHNKNHLKVGLIHQRLISMIFIWLILFSFARAKDIFWKISFLRLRRYPRFLKFFLNYRFILQKLMNKLSSIPILFLSHERSTQYLLKTLINHYVNLWEDLSRQAAENKWNDQEFKKIMYCIWYAVDEVLRRLLGKMISFWIRQNVSYNKKD